MKYEIYIRLPFPDYQDLMETHSDEWVDEVIAIGDSDVLVPLQWVENEEICSLCGQEILNNK